MTGVSDRSEVVSAQGLLDEVERLADRADRLEAEADADSGLERWAQLGMMAAAIAHEINGLLTPLTGYADLALMSPENGRLRERALRSASESGRQAAAVLEAVLELSRVAEGSGEASGGLTDASRDQVGEGCRADELLAAWVKLSEDLTGAERVEAVIGEGVGAGDMVPIRLQAVQIVLGNLMRNALKTGPDTRVRLSVGQSAAGWMIDVQDDGVGVPAELADSVFDWGSTGNERTGYGIGLSLARALAARAGGDLVLMGSDGPSAAEVSDGGWGGAWFRLSLPAIG